MRLCDFEYIYGLPARPPAPACSYAICIQAGELITIDEWTAIRSRDGYHRNFEIPDFNTTTDYDSVGRIF